MIGSIGMGLKMKIRFGNSHKPRSRIANSYQSTPTQANLQLDTSVFYNHHMMTVLIIQITASAYQINDL